MDPLCNWSPKAIHKKPSVAGYWTPAATPGQCDFSVLRCRSPSQCPMNVPCMEASIFSESQYFVKIVPYVVLISYDNLPQNTSRFACQGVGAGQSFAQGPGMRFIMEVGQMRMNRSWP